MDFFDTSARLSCGYHSRCAASSTTSCSTTIVTTVSPAINSTSHPSQTGFSTGGGAVGTCATVAVANGFGVSGVGGSALTKGCGSNCGLSGDDKIFLVLPDSLGPVYEILRKYFGCRDRLSTQALSS